MMVTQTNAIYSAGYPPIINKVKRDHIINVSITKKGKIIKTKIFFLGC